MVEGVAVRMEQGTAMVAVTEAAAEVAGSAVVEEAVYNWDGA